MMKAQVMDACFIVRLKPALNPLKNFQQLSILRIWG
jgi:hypothetical protein